MVQSITITSLPTEILDCIFDHAVNLPLIGAYSATSFSKDRDERLRDVKSLRLTCRVFQRLASLYFLPVLQVHLSHASLERAAAVSRNPFIAAGVRKLQVNLAYHPAELAQDIKGLAKLRLAELDRLRARCENRVMSLPDDMCGSQEEENAQNAIDAHFDIELAWDAYLDKTSHTTPTNENEELSEGEVSVARYQDILAQGFDAFCKLHDEQRRLLTDGSFVKSLAESVSRMPNVKTLAFVDQSNETRLRYHGSAFEPLVNMDELLRFITRPLTWKDTEGLTVPNGFPELVPASILFELPVSLWQATGSHLEEIYVTCFPIKTRYSVLKPAMYNWDLLSHACQRLRVFCFGHGVDMDSPPGRGRLPHPTSEDWVYMRDYLLSSLSSTHLRRLTLSLRAFGQNHLGVSGKKGGLDLNQVLSNLHLPQAERVLIEDVSLNQASLEAFATNLGGKSLKTLMLSDCHLKEGSWSHAFDLLRNKLSATCQQGQCKLQFFRFTGGEFDRESEIIGPDDEKPPELENDYSFACPPRTPNLEAEVFISGWEQAPNPCIKHCSWAQLTSYLRARDLKCKYGYFWSGDW